MQKILRNGKTVTIFTVGTGGMYDQRITGAEHLPRPAQWHRIAVHNEWLGAYSVQQLEKKYAIFYSFNLNNSILLRDKFSCGIFLNVDVFSCFPVCIVMLFFSF